MPDKLVNVKVVDIKTTKLNPRKHFDKEKLKELAESIKEVGLDKPLILRKKGKKYELAAGERRLKAAKMAKVHKVQAVVKDLEDREIVEMQLRDILSEGLSPIEQATAFKQLRDDYGVKEVDIGKRYGKSQSWVSDRIRLLGLPEELHEHITRGILGAGHAKALLKLKNPKDQLAVAEELKDYDGEFNPSVRDTEDVVNEFLRAEKTEKEFAKVMKKAKVKTCRDPKCGNKAFRVSNIEGKTVLTCSSYHRIGHCWDPTTGEVVYTASEIQDKEHRKQKAKEAAEKRKGKPKGKRKPVHIPTRPAWFFSLASKQEWANALMKTSADSVSSLVFGPPPQHHYGIHPSGTYMGTIKGVLQAVYSDKLLLDQRIYVVSVEDSPAAKGFKTRITIGEYRSASSQGDNVAREKKNVEKVEGAIKKLLAFQRKHIGVKQTAKQTMIKAVNGVKLGAKVKVSKKCLTKSYQGAGAEVVGFTQNGSAVLNYSKVQKVFPVNVLEVVVKKGA